MKTPLTQTQLALYYESISKEELPIYVVPVLFSLEDNLDIERLKTSVEKALNKFAILNKVIVKDEDGMPFLEEPADGKDLECVIEKKNSEFIEKLRTGIPEGFDLNGGRLCSANIYVTPEKNYLYLRIHHSIADGSSFIMVINTIHSEYVGEEYPDQTLTIFDIQKKEEELRASSKYDEAKQWYADNFGTIECDCNPLPDILTERKSEEGNILTTIRRKVATLDVDYDKAFAFSRELKVPISVVFDGAFGYMVGNWSALSESVFSTIFSGRSTDEERLVCGMMVKTLPVYCAWHKDTEVVDYLNQLAQQRKAVKNWSDTFSFAEVCKETGISPALSFCYRGSIQGENIVIPGLCTASERIGYYTTGDTLQFLLDHLDGKLVLRAEYQSTQYTEEFIESMMETYATVLAGMLEHKKLSEIQFCSPKMAAKLDSFNATIDRLNPEGVTIVDLFRKHVVETPDRFLVKNDDRELTYGEVGREAVKIASYVRSLGIGEGDAVAVMADRNAQMVSATMGVLCSGAAYQPLDASYPAARLNYMMRDADVRLLIADPNLKLELEDDLKEKITILNIDKISELPDGNLFEFNSPAPTSTFILLYTSGTTGVPKGVRLTHENLMALYGVNLREIPEVCSPEDTWAMYASYGFDAGFYTLLMPICFGGAVSIVPEDLRLDMEGVNQFYMRHGVTHTLMTTQVGRIFATTIEQTSLKTLMVGGEKLVPCEPPKNYKLINVYGPTEGTVYCNGKDVDRIYTRVPIGRHNDDYRDYIVDSLGRLMPPGALGELLIAGPQVGNGYLNLPERTAKSFGKNPFTDDSLYANIYHTGDIVRLLPVSGEADIIGRNDGQVKIRGFRIELSEVEKVIRDYPGITDVTVQAFDNPTGGKYIAAYVVAPEPVDFAALSEFIAERKPPYMVPEAMMQLEKIPLTQNQKVDKRSLPEPTKNVEASTQEENRTPNLLEKEICAIVGDVLKLEEVPLTIQLSHLGLSSISSIRLASALFKRFGVSLKGASLVKNATVVSIEDEILEKLLGGAKPAPTQEKEEKKSDDTAPLTVSQQGVYADTMRNPDTTSYNIPICLRFDAETDPQALVAALKRILDAHPYLRDAHLRLGDDDVEQTILPAIPAEVKVSEMTYDKFIDYRAGYIQPFDLMAAPLHRLEVVKTPEGVFMLLDVHHIVFDGTSLSVMLSQLKRLLEGGNVSDEEFDYLDYADFERNWMDGKEGAKSASFFKEMLSDCEAASDIPSDMPQSLDAGERGIITREIDIRSAEDFCRAHQLTPAALYLSAVCYATARFTSSRSAYISTISSGRSDVRFSDTFGMFVKTLPIAMNIGEESALDFALRGNSLLARVVENEMYPYAKICADYNYAPNIVYEYQYGIVEDVTINGKPVTRELIDTDTLKFKIGVRVEEVDGKPSVAIHYRKGIYSDGLMRTYAESIATVAERIIAAPASPARRISMTTPEQDEILKRFSATEVTQPSGKCLHELMEEQARLHPERKAVVASDRTLTYAELDRLANVVANNLIARGVKKGDKVVLLLSRTSRFLTSLYGVLKAGAAYIPSSPDYPEERKQSIIEDSEAALVITDENVDELHIGDNDTKPAVEVTPEDLVYLIYTSGSTGKPKGVLLRHRGIVNYVTPGKSVIHTDAIVKNATTVGSITTVAFDMALKEWGIALSNGLTLVFAPDEATNDPVALAELFTRNGVDYFNTTPSRMQQYMELEEFASMLSRCKVVICGAEKYPEYLVQRLREIAPDAVIFNTYGPTEITVSSNACNLTKSPSVSVGRPLRNYIEHVVDMDDNVLPPGVIGELLISGTNIARGYNANPEQTKKAFITFQSPFDIYAEPLPTYRSGDYARWDGDGNVVILGRKDTQVKLRGLRIELGEIERVIGDIEGIGASHIMIRDVAGKENLVAYYSLKNGVKLSADELKARMAEKLTDYMLPSFFVEMETMPLTPNGKINTRALPEPAIGEREAGREAATELERFFVDVYKKILGNDTVYADDSFFALGGTSLTATRIMIAAAKQGHRIVYADIFAHPTPEELAALIEGRGTVKIEPQILGGAAEQKESIYESTDYDYSAINRVLAGNTLDAFRNGELRQLGTVLLTGATGYAGIHVLNELLTSYDSEVVCLIRDSRSGIPAAERLEQLYFYYFGKSLAEEFPGRVIVKNGDITKITPDLDLDIKIDTVINCAANVKHFSAGTDIEDINYYGVLNLIDWCKTHDALLVQTSTTSVTGRQPADRYAVLDEQSLYIGQDFDNNKYITSKFMAERAVLEAHAKGEIVGKVVRLGNLAPRETDGEFQINFRTNGFMNRLKSIVLVGCYPYEMYKQNKDISPIDDVAAAIVRFAQTPDACVVFHGNNANRYSLGNFYYQASRCGLDINPVETAIFAEALDKAKEDPDKLPALVGLMAYEGMGAGLKPVDYSNDYSAQVLLRMNFHWPVISSEYVRKLIKQLESLGFFSI